MSTFSNVPVGYVYTKAMFSNGFKPTFGHVAPCDKYIIGSPDITDPGPTTTSIIEFLE